MKGATHFFQSIWDTIQNKQEEGIYNTVCLVVLLALPFLLFMICIIICCHYGCCCCSRKPPPAGQQQVKKRKKKKNQVDDLWISTKPKSMMMEMGPVPV
ncbi:uncharacterized protein KIAA0040 homolog [Latimeria chalumnae]|uniref:KIAA0040 n=1 Tax=Latimeria chalumnae TaxID=7897 RepID=M3XK11_LATCH|nr:PREDICTED: uncharacterized protein KIAA0040 homolog [Latimeria chalumnae]|eukprot:XP_014344365.1 PREDICTED: uncharacterized protein KIAA0040 homolog [Latimeria chalumnae]